MGASNPHPHGQIWAGDGPARRGAARGRDAARVPRRDRAPAAARLRRRRSGAGRGSSTRTTSWLVVVPFWAAWPFETLLIAARAGGAPGRPRRRRLATGSPARCATSPGRYDALFERPFPYSMGWHQAPFGGGRRPATGSSTRTSTRRSCARQRAQVHGRLRAARRAAARPHPRGGRRAAPRDASSRPASRTRCRRRVPAATMAGTGRRAHAALGRPVRARRAGCADGGLHPVDRRRRRARARRHRRARSPTSAGSAAPGC